MSLTLKKLDGKLAQNKVSLLYFIAGTETFLIRESLRMIKSYILDSSAMDFNYETVSAGDVPIARIRAAVETLPVFAPKRIIVCEKAHNLKENDWKILEPVIKKPIDTSILIFVSDKPDKRQKIIKQLLSYCEEISAQTPKENEWPTWIEWMGRKKGLHFSSSAIAVLKQYTGHNLISLENEVNKLSSFLGDKKNVSTEDVLNIVPRTRPENIFALSQAIGQKNLSSALLCLTRLLEDNQNEVGALALIIRHIRILIRVKEGVIKKLSPSDICQRTGVPLFFIQTYIKEARLWTETALMFAINQLQDIDKAIKSSSTPSSMWLENFIIKVCSY